MRTGRKDNIRRREFHLCTKKPPYFRLENAGAADLEDQFRAYLKLPGVEGGARYTHLPAGSGDAITKVLRLRANEIGSAIDGKHLIHVHPIEEIERIQGEVQFGALVEPDCACQAEIDRFEVVTTVGIASEGANPVGHRIAAVVGIKAGKQGKRTGRLQGNNAAELKIAQQLPLLGRVRDKVRHKAVPRILIG